MSKLTTVTRIMLFVLIAASATAITRLPARADESAAAVAHVTIDSGTVLATVTDLSFGINTSVYDSHLMDPSVPNLVKQAGFTAMRYPGGSTSDEYHWQTNAYTPKAANGAPGKANAANDFDHFLNLTRSNDIEPIVTINYGSNATRSAGGDPAEAAAWVAYSKQKGYKVHYWEIGNELYGNGFYGADWETDLHAPKDGVDAITRKNNPLLGPAAYGRNVVAFVHAMKAKDRSIKIGAVLAAAESFPDGDKPDWNSGVLKECGHDIDFAIIHVYPQNNGTESDAGLLSQPAKNAGIIAALRPEMARYCGKQIPIFVTEVNSVNTQPGKQSVSQVNALFAADNVLSWIEAGAANVDWWQLHNGPTTNANNSPQLFGDATFGDYGVLMNGDNPEPAANTPQQTYYAFAMLHKAIAPGDTLVKAICDQPLVKVHAVLHRDMNGKSSYQLLVINESPKQTYQIEGSTGLPIPGWSLTSGDAGLSYAPEVGTALEYKDWKLPPYSVTQFTLK